MTECSQDSAIEIIKQKLTIFSSKKIAALVGNTLDCESIFAFKSFLDELKIDNYDCRQDNSYFDPTNRSSYLFNSAIKGIDESDLCFLVGTDIKTFNDHRIAMAFSIAGLVSDGKNNLDNINCVKISCPNFYQLLEDLIN